MATLDDFETLAALDMLDDNVVVYDREWRFLFVNQAALKLANLKKSDMLGKSYWEVFPGLLDTPVHGALQSAFDSKEKVTLELQSPMTGQWFKMEIIPSNSTLLVRTTDISDRKQAREHSKRLMASLDAMSDPIIMMDRQWRYTFVNIAATGFIKRERDELLGNNVWELSPWLRDTPFGRACFKAMEAGKPFSLEDHYRPRNRWLKVHYFPGPDGVTVHITDINNYKQSQLKLAKLLAPGTTAKQIRKAFDLISHPMLMLDAELRYTYANGPALEPNNRKPEEVIGARMGDLNPGLKDSDLAKRCQEALRSKQRQQFEAVLPPSGKWYQVELIPWRDQLILSALDISKLKKSQASMGILTDTLERALDDRWNRTNGRDPGQSAHTHKNKK